MVPPAPRSRKRGPPQATIHSLPPELIRCIIDEVEKQSLRERHSMHVLAALGAEMGVDMNEIINQGPAAFFAMLDGLANAPGRPMGPLVPPAAPGHGHAHHHGASVPAPVPPAPAPAQPAAAIRDPFNFDLNVNAPPVAGDRAQPAPGHATGPGEFDDMPPLEDVSDVETRAPVASTSAPVPAANPVQPAAPVTAVPPQFWAQTELEEGGMPPLEEIDSDGGMPALEDIDEDVDSGMRELEDLSDGGSAGDEDVWEETEDDEGDEDDEDEDEYSGADEFDADSDDESNTYPDGLPEDPLLPIFFASRPFLHTSREKLYRTIFLGSVWQASLLLRSLTAPYHAARDVHEVADPHAPANVLASLIRSLSIAFSPENGVVELSHRRGGASVLVELMERCTALEALVVRPMFLKSSTKPFLAALRKLKNLQRLDITSGTDPVKPCVITTARVVDLLQNHLFELHDLTVAFLRPAEDGPCSEEDAMWEYEYFTSLEEYEEGTREAFDSDGEPELPKPKPKGLTALKLLDPYVPSLELALILKDSRDTLKTFLLSRPSPRLSRFGLASTIVNFCTHLTEIRLDCAPSWYPIQKPLIKVPFPARPKDFVAGKPTDEQLRALAAYPFFLDAVLPYMPHLIILRFDGPLASTSAFSFMPVSLSTIEWSHCPSITPGPLARLLNKSVSRTKSTKAADGSVTTASIKTIVAKGLICLSIKHDDLQWKDNDIRALEQACETRNACIHLSGGASGGPQVFPVAMPAAGPGLGMGIPFPFVPIVRV